MRLPFLTAWHLERRWPELFAGEDGGDLFAEVVADAFDRAVAVDNGKTVSGLKLPELLFHRALILHETVEHVAGKADVHAAFPVIERHIFGEVPLDQFFGGDI